jgi:hypothetical protein
LKAVAELTQANGFLGSLSIEKYAFNFKFYRECIQFINKGQSFRSVMSHGILSAVDGNFGFHVPEGAETRVKAGPVGGDGSGVFLWPLAGMIWAFDPCKMAERSLMSKWIREVETPFEAQAKLDEERAKLKAEGKLLKWVNLPAQQEIILKRMGAVSKAYVATNDTNTNSNANKKRGKQASNKQKNNSIDNSNANDNKTNNLLEKSAPSEEDFQEFFATGRIFLPILFLAGFYYYHVRRVHEW